MSTFDWKTWPWEKHIGQGWQPMVTKLVEICVAQDIEIISIKQKFGGLRFYVGNCSKGLEQLIDAAEAYSYHICEFCGNPGKRRDDLSWIFTLCDACYKAHHEREDHEN